MKLKECTLGKLVITNNMEVGHIVGLTYNVDISMTGNMTAVEKFDRTIPIVRFPSGERKIHHENLKAF